MNNLLMREIPLNCTIRLWDTYHVSSRSDRRFRDFVRFELVLFGCQAEPFGFSDFHLYVCTAFLRRYSKEILAEKDFQVSARPPAARVLKKWSRMKKLILAIRFQGLMLLLQNLPTKNMKANDVTLLTAEAYKLQVMFANSPNHTAT